MSEQLREIRAVGALAEAVSGLNEKKRQRIARIGFDAAFGLSGRLADLVECEACGLLDDVSPCGDHEVVSDE